MTFVLAGVSPAAAESFPNQDLVNRMDGSRLALSSNSLSEGAQVISLRSTAWDSYSTEAWDAEGTYDSASQLWTFTLRNLASNKCLQPNDTTPARGEAVVVRTCNGSDVQKWSVRKESPNESDPRWFVWRPYLNVDVAMTLKGTTDTWDTIELDYSYPSADRLWRLGPNNSAWW
ncbi:RICIN domain-containing protein [Streptomyces erythrochromogenes]